MPSIRIVSYMFSLTWRWSPAILVRLAVHWFPPGPSRLSKVQRPRLIYFLIGHTFFVCADGCSLPCSDCAYRVVSCQILKFPLWLILLRQHCPLRCGLRRTHPLSAYAAPRIIQTVSRFPRLLVCSNYWQWISWRCRTLLATSPPIRETGRPLGNVMILA